MIDINDLIFKLGNKYGTYITNYININDYISLLANYYGSYIFHG